jgi:hypothetical protein
MAHEIQRLLANSKDFFFLVVFSSVESKWARDEGSFRVKMSVFLFYIQQDHSHINPGEKQTSTYREGKKEK